MVISANDIILGQVIKEITFIPDSCKYKQHM